MKALATMLDRESVIDGPRYIDLPLGTGDGPSASVPADALPDVPDVSVIMPMRNARPYVQKAARSVLSQAGVSLELVVVDDGSTDGSADTLRELGDPRVRILPGPARGIAHAFNTAVAAARGTYLARCDADDLFPDGRLRDQLALLRSRPEFGAVCGGFEMTSPKGASLCDLSLTGHDEEITDELRRGTIRTHACTFLVRTDLIRQVGGCRPFFVTGEDIDLQLRLGEATRVWYQSVRRYSYRLHGASITHQVSRSWTSYYDQCARQFQIQREQEGQDDLQAGREPRCSISHDASAPSVDRQVQDILLSHAWQHHTSGRKLRGILTGVRAGLSKPQHLRTWRSIAALVVKRPGNGRVHAAS